MLWGAIQPAESLQTRLRLDFGLRPAVLTFNEWAVPGLGGAFFVRQLTWGCVGIRFAEELGQPLMAARIAEAIEAFASWVALKGGGRDYAKDDRIQGKRKFSDVESLSFNTVAKAGAYVTVPFRRAATAALPGLGFCEKPEARFNALKLNQAGKALAEAAFVGDGARRILLEWVSQRSKPYKRVERAVQMALLPHAATKEECDLVEDRLRADPRRALLMQLISKEEDALSSLSGSPGLSVFLRSIQDDLHRRRLDACFAFERVRTSALWAGQSLANAIGASALSFGEIAGSKEIRRAFDDLARRCDELARKLTGLTDVPDEIQRFCAEQDAAQRLEDRTRLLAGRVPLVFSVLDGRLDRGVGYTSELVPAEASEPVEGEAQPENGAIPRPLLRLKRLCRELTAEVPDED